MSLGLPYINFPHRDSLGCIQYDAVQSCRFDGFRTKWIEGWWPQAAVVIFHPCLHAEMNISRIHVVPRSLILDRIYSSSIESKLQAPTLTSHAAD